MSEDHRLDSPPGASRSRRANVVKARTNLVEESSIDFLRVAQDTLHLHPSNNNKHPTTFIPSNSINQGLFGEPASQVQPAPPGEEEGPNLQLVDAELQGASDGTESMRPLRGHATSMASATNKAPAGLTAVDDFETTYLQHLKIVDVVLEKIVDVYPYARWRWVCCPAASKIIITQAECDKSICSLLQKLAEVYRFMTQDDSLVKIESMRGIVGKIIQQTLECARFIRDYSETKSFRVGKNIISETDDIIKQNSDTLDIVVFKLGLASQNPILL
ncbi:hypothetical protein DFJ58DRAFT_722459 [Suillus subalutaceus]|uniref:uncharacterized protein n=1 Tax=Suillus subalutaceus TaxID=48586 RepID=UPI001B868D36|nr:uncharacterized protein DFJ58DRAFT_722459 [Suillus subalutaceus]KAG1871726.1 hypothetical protein DFJ58DRAFT_722459 [Suillus subalutaceus]